MDAEKKCLSCLDISYSYELAKRMEKEKTNPVLGYRTAGSKAERATGEMLYQEMKRIGFPEVTRDEFTVDSWEFERAVLKFTDAHGQERVCQMGAYQTDFDTDGFCEYEIEDIGKGTAREYEGRDVRGKLVLARMNQRDEWWINYPVYQAHLRGAAALIAVQEQGYGEIHETSLNAQDIAGPADAPAFSLSLADAAALRAAMEKSREEGQPFRVMLDAHSRVRRDQKSYNIVARIPGESTDSMILLSAHYDSYFDGFQDDNSAVAMMIGIGRAILRGGFRPRHTLVFCAMAAEEWGVTDSKYDWSAGAYSEVFRVHPDWSGHVIADLNFELPAHAHHTRDAVRCTYEYETFLREIVKSVHVPEDAYPDGMTVLSPIETWSDDFSMAIAGIPSMVNDFSAGPFMQECYHSQFDNDRLYQESVYRFHHSFYLSLLFRLDELVLAPLDFANLFRAVKEHVDPEMGEKTGAGWRNLLQLLEEAEQSAGALYREIEGVNSTFVCRDDAEKASADQKLAKVQEDLLAMFRKAQDYFVRLDFEDTVIFPHEASARNLRALEQAVRDLKKGDPGEAVLALCQVDNNYYAFQFDREVYRHFTDYILKQSGERLMWGAGRIIHHEDLYETAQALAKKAEKKEICAADCEKERKELEQAWKRQCTYHVDDVEYLCRAVRKLTGRMEETTEKLQKIRKNFMQ